MLPAPQRRLPAQCRHAETLERARKAVSAMQSWRDDAMHKLSAPRGLSPAPWHSRQGNCKRRTPALLRSLHAT